MIAATGKTVTGNVLLLWNVHVEAKTWAEKHGCQFPISKYQLTHFSKRNGEDIDIPLKIGAQVVPAKLHSRFLGVLMDSKLNRREHVNHVKGKASKSIVAMARLAGSTWGVVYSL